MGGGGGGVEIPKKDIVHKLYILKGEKTGEDSGWLSDEGPVWDRDARKDKIPDSLTWLCWRYILSFYSIKGICISIVFLRNHGVLALVLRKGPM